MGKLFNVMPGPASGKRLQGNARFHELLGRDTIRFMKVNLMTLLGFAPYAAALVISVLTSSILVLIPACMLSGILAGPALSCMYDCVFRSLRDAPGRIWENYKKAWKQNFKASVLPGMLFCTISGLYCFVLAMFSWARFSQTAGTYIAYFVGLMVFSLIFTILWPLITLFDQKPSDQVRNIILFAARYLWKVLLCAFLNAVYWMIMVLFLPWSVFLLPLIGFWFIVFLTSFILYGPLNEAFGIEDAISESFPDQVPYYETDDEWAERRMKEDAAERARLFEEQEKKEAAKKTAETEASGSPEDPKKP